MNLERLQQAQDIFFQRYPEGFQDPEMIAIGKKHKMGQMIALAQERFAKPKFANPDTIVEDMLKLTQRSSMISIFEKPKFKDFVKSLSADDLKKLSNGFKSFLYGDQEKGFDMLLALLLPHKLAKWSLMTILPNYVFPDSEVFVKPSTCKHVIQSFELNHLHYRAEPSWQFYQDYRDCILKMKAMVPESLAPNNAAFCGFLMMTMPELNAAYLG